MYNVYIRKNIYRESGEFYNESMKNYNLKIQGKTVYRTLPGMVADLLREDILSGKLSGGAQLKQEELAAKFNVSMSALREALKNLEAEGLVRFYPNRGAVVSELSAAEAQEIFEIRLFLELGALELSIPNLTEADLAAAEEFLQEADQENQIERCSELNWQFHQALYQPAHRPNLLTLIQNMNNNVTRYMNLYLSTLHYQLKSQKEHHLLLDACRNKNVKQAQTVLRAHMAAASKRLQNYLAQ